MSPPDGSGDPEGETSMPGPETSLAALGQVAEAVAIAHRLQSDVEMQLLRSVVDAASSLFDAAAASIALYDADVDRLVFRVASGTRGAGIVGVSVPPTQGLVGHVFTSGEPVALSDVAADPHFDLATAQRTGYVPRSLAAVPLVDRQVRVGVLQVLDKRAAEAFSDRDIELLEAFARQAGAVIEAARAGHDSRGLLGGAIAAVAHGALRPEQVEQLLDSLGDRLDDHAESPFWTLVDEVARTRRGSDSDAALVTELLEIAVRRLAAPE